MNSAPNNSSPTNVRERLDPGDETIRRFRYQSAYGVVLLAAMARKDADYIALWCEQHEDLLAQISDTQYDAYQVKTRNQDLGRWKITDAGLVKSIWRFVELDLMYPNWIREFKFVSNTECSNTSDRDKIHLSPKKLVVGVEEQEKWEDLKGDLEKGFGSLKDNIEKNHGSIDPKNLFAVLKRLDLVLGPTDRAFEEELNQRHLATLPQCMPMNALTLSRVRDCLMEKVTTASSLYTSSPTQHWLGTKHLQDDPQLAAKRLTVEDITIIIQDVAMGGLQFLPGLASLDLGSASKKVDILEKKMEYGGLAIHHDTMKRRALSAERMLLELATRPENGSVALSQIESVVKGECDDSHLRVAQKDEQFGREMLIDVQNKLQEIAKNEPSRVYKQPWDCLVGVAGLLTSDCKVWWSERFDLDATP